MKNKAGAPITQEDLNMAISAGEDKVRKFGYAKAITFDSITRTFIISFSNNNVIFLPVDNYEEFKHIPNNDLMLVKIGFAGTAICLERCDLHVYIPGMIDIDIQ